MTIHPRRLTPATTPAASLAAHGGHAYRPDIDGLRALAVVPVVLFHAHVHPFSGGFVGVDIFFVISGYLITSILAADMRQGRLSIARFYQRRIRRIFPALFAMASVCVALAAWAFPPQDFAQFGQSLVAMALFASNIFFDATHTAAGYFDVAAQTQILLHTWSLAVEEQFYILLPLALLLMRHRDEGLIVRVLAVVAALSFAFSQWAVVHWPTDAFYNVASRAWELLTGSLLALRPLPRLKGRLPREAGAGLGLALILVAIFGFTERTPFPGAAALLPCLGAALLIGSGGMGPTLVGRVLASRVPVAIGLVSYSLYLWHWPIIVMTRYLGAGVLPAPATIAAIVLSFVAAGLSYRFIEQPFRHGGAGLARRVVLGAGIGASCLVAGLGLVIVAGHGIPARFDEATLDVIARNLARESDHPSMACENYRGDIKSVDDFVFCSVGKGEPSKILVWGDSHAGALVPLMHRLYDERALDGRGVVFAVAAGCAPARGLNTTLASQCDTYARWSLARAEQKDIGTVLINFSGWWELFEGALCRQRDGKCVERLTTIGAEDAFVADLRTEVAELVSHGKHVVLGLPWPSYNRSIPQMQINAAVLGGFDRMLRQIGFNQLDRNDFSRLRRRVKEIADDLGVGVFDPRDGLCKGGDCRYARDRVSMYVDRDHIATGEIDVFRDALASALKEDEPLPARVAASAPRDDLGQ